MKSLPFTLAIAGMLLITACSKEINTDQQTARSLDGTEALKQQNIQHPIQFTQENLFPEGVVYDPFNNRFYVSSVSRGDIGIVTADGSYTAFITDPVLLATTGLEIDKARKRLYVSNAPNGVGVYDINTGERIYYIGLTALMPGAPVFINDIALDPQGNAYITNSFYPVIYKITPTGEASIFYYEPALALPPGSFGFNGIEHGNNGYLLVAYSAMNAILKIPLSDPTAYSYVMLDAALMGPDGLLLSNNGKELTVVNNAGGGQGYVSTFTSTDNWESGTSSSTFNTGSVFPTTATSDGKNVFVVYAYLHWRGTGQSEFTIQPIP